MSSIGLMGQRDGTSLAAKGDEEVYAEIRATLDQARKFTAHGRP